MTRLNADLANDLGNLVNRACSMIGRYCEGHVPAVRTVEGPDAALRQAAAMLPSAIDPLMRRLEFSAALEAIMQTVTSANQYIEAVAPWKLAKDPQQAPRLQTVLGLLAEVIRVVATALEPFMPSVSAAMHEQLGGPRIGPHPVLFPRNEPARLS